MRRAEVWLVRFDPTIGAEINKTRPAAIVSDETVGVLPLAVIVPITKWRDQHTGRSWIVRLEPSAENGLAKLSAADTFQVRSLSQERFIRKLGTLSNAEIQEITNALAIVLNIDF